MSRRFWRKLAILHKIETVYGTDIVPTAADAILATNVSFMPMEGDEVSRDLMLPYLGAQGIVLAGTYGRIEFDIEVAGSGAVGTPPAYGSLLRIAGLAETIDAGVDVTYSPIDDDREAGSIYFVSDKVRHVLLGCRANVSVTLTPKQIPKFRFTVTGLLGTISDQVSMPAVSQAGWKVPVVVSKAQTAMSLHGWPAVAESLTLDLGNTIVPRFLIGDEAVEITDRQSSGTAVVEARPLADVDWFGKAMSRARGALLLTHGTVAGNIVEFAAPAVEIGKPTQGNTDGILNYSLPLTLATTAGLDEIAITIR